MIAADYAARAAGVSFSEALIRDETLVEAYSAVVDRFAPEGLVFFTDTTLEAEALGLELAFYPESSPHPARFITPDQFRPVDPERDGRMPVYLKALRELNRRFGSQIPIFASLKDPFSLAAQAVDPAYLLEAVILNPDEVNRMLSIVEMNQARYLECIIKAGGIPFVGAPFASASLISAEVFRQFVAGSIKRLARQAHRAGSPLALHICGRVDALGAVIAGTEIDIFSLEAVDPNIKNLYLKDLVLMGVVKTDVMLNGTPEDVYNEVQRSRELLQPRWILSTGCDVPVGTPVENMQALRSLTGI